MPRIKALNTYPAGYWQIIEQCATRGTCFEQRLFSITQALSLQGQFYAFRGALRKAYDHALAHPDVDQAYTAKLRAAIEFAEVTVCWVDRSGANTGESVRVCFMHRDNTPASQLVNKFLKEGTQTGQPIESEIERSQKELLEKLNNTGGKDEDKGI